jgi:hypothetical protein
MRTARTFSAYPPFRQLGVAHDADDGKKARKSDQTEAIDDRATLGHAGGQA